MRGGKTRSRITGPPVAWAMTACCLIEASSPTTVRMSSAIVWSILRDPQMPHESAAIEQLEHKKRAGHRGIRGSFHSVYETVGWSASSSDSEYESSSLLPPPYEQSTVMSMHRLVCEFDGLRWRSRTAACDSLAVMIRRRARERNYAVGRTVR